MSTVTAPATPRSSSVRGLSLLGGAENDPGHPFPQVPQRARVVGPVDQGQDRHQLGSDGDVESGFPRTALVAAAEADDDVAQGPVVDVEHPVPLQVENVDPEALQADLGQGLVAQAGFVEPAGVDGGGHQVVSNGDGVDVAGQVEVELVHRAPPGCSPRRPRHP